MNIAFHAGATGLLAFQSALDNTGNNIANSNTAGYKAYKSNFSNLIAQQMYVNGDDKPLSGSGVKFDEAAMIYTQGVPGATGRALDFAILGDGMFAVEHGGTIQYTRNGAFAVGSFDGQAYLVALDGSFVLDHQGNRITVARDPETDAAELTGIIDKLGIYTCQNPEAMTPLSATRFAPSEASGEIRAMNAGNQVANRPYQLISGSLEQSGVDALNEMTDMILTQRAFQMSAKVVQTADQIEEIVNNLRK